MVEPVQIRLAALESTIISDEMNRLRTSLAANIGSQVGNNIAVSIHSCFTYKKHILEYVLS